MTSRHTRRAKREARKTAKAAMKARRAAVKARLADARAAAKRRPEARRAERQRRRRRRLALLALLLLLLLLRRCECDEPGIGVAPEPDVGVDAALIIADMGPDAAKPPTKKATRKRPIRARIDRTERPAFRNPPPPAADWLAALRIQVAARGPRLARCFEGSDRPGALEWRAVVDVARGVASDHAFEPVLGGAQLGKALERCLTDVLADPPYRLPATEDAGRPRVSIIVEF